MHLRSKFFVWKNLRPARAIRVAKYMKNKFFVWRIFPWYLPLFWVIYAILISFLFKHTDWVRPIPVAIPSIIGTAISLFLGFRTNSAYQRWWEARKVWGEIVNNSRTLARQVLTFGNINKNLQERKAIIYKHIHWCWSFACSLRNLTFIPTQKKYITEAERKSLKASTNVPNRILLNQQKDIYKLTKNRSIDQFDYRKIDNTLKFLCDAMGKCERIKSTVFPTQYSLYTKVFLYIFLFLLPLGMVDSLGYASTLVQLLIGYTFIMIQNIAHSLQDPFENKPSDIPVFAISRTVERNLLEMIGEKNIPDKWKPKNDILM